MDFSNVNPRTKIVLIPLGVCAVLGLIPSMSIPVILLKVLAFGSLFGLVYYFFVDDRLDKDIVIIVDDVQRSKKDEYREQIRSALDSFGEVVRLEEDLNEIALAVPETTATMTNVDRAVEGSEAKLNRDNARGIIEYSSLGAQASMTVTIEGSATPGSEVFIDGVSQPISVGRGGGFAVEVPLSLVQKHQDQSYIPATCRKRDIEEEIEIPVSG